MPHTEHVTEKKGFSIDELATGLGLSSMFLRKEVWAGRLRATRFGRRIVILKPDWENYLKSRPTNAAQ